MTKLEELTALLVEELNDFSKDIEKLEAISKELKDLRIKMDISEYKAIITENKQQIDTFNGSLERFESRFNDKINQAKIYPTWAVVTFIICLVICIGLVFYVFLN